MRKYMLLSWRPNGTPGYALIIESGAIAQSVEQRPFKAWVEGSNPPCPTRF